MLEKTSNMREKTGNMLEKPVREEIIILKNMLFDR